MRYSPEQASYGILDRFNKKDRKPKNTEKLNQAQEKETQGQALALEIAQLREQASTKEDYEALLEKLQKLERLFVGGETAEMQEARELLGENFFGKEEIKSAFGIETSDSEIPPIPYSREDLEKAKELGEMLVLRVSHDNNGKALTMQHMHAMLEQRFQQESKGKILFKVDWYANEDFFTKDRPRNEWKLVSKNVIPDSTDKDYIEQTRCLRDYLAKHNLISKEELDDCSDAKLEAIRNFMEADYDTNWPEAARQLSELMINLNHRRMPTEVLYDWLLVMGSKGERLLERIYEWTARRSSDGDLVSFGSAGAGGAYVRRDGPRHSGGALGVVSSR